MVELPLAFYDREIHFNSKKITMLRFFEWDVIFPEAEASAAISMILQMRPLSILSLTSNQDIGDSNLPVF